MKTKIFIIITSAFLALLTMAVTAEDAPASPVKSTARYITDDLPDFNKTVLRIAAEYPTDGTIDYWWPRNGEGQYDGCSTDLFLDGNKVMDGEPKKRTYCCGLTLEVFLRAYNEKQEKADDNESKKLSAENFSKFQKLWFVGEHNGPGPSKALEDYKMGREIEPTEAKAGDFVQIWRTKNKKGKMTGHSVIFLEWVKSEEDDIIGMRYWSTQPGTDGISERIEYYGPGGGISTQYTWFGRVEL